VIEMQNAEREAEIFSERDNQQQQCHGIRPAGNAHAHPLARSQQATAANTILQSLRQQCSGTLPRRFLFRQPCHPSPPQRIL